MYNVVITRISCQAIFKHAFFAGTFLSGSAGMLLGLLEQQFVTVLGGAFLGLAAGLSLGLAAMLAAAIFNLLAPWLGGVALHIETATTLESTETELPLATRLKEQQSLFP